MNKKQLYILAWGFMIIGMMFIYLDLNANSNLTNSLLSDQPFDITDAYYVMNGEMFEPFIWTFYSLWILFMVLAWQTKK